ncbi:helicase-related protein [Paenibacillus sp. HB172176]|uniref:DEAD/DEAH box helicase n=1 Tax=Paenibacillus sp. HB172176 TaxID=2493690 RepID=UPI001F0EF859|nr:helicase-related protein [Paenibacillus sp. HB172176]
MRAYVYAIKREGCWEANLTIAPRVDYIYWFAEGWDVASGERGWFWTEPLPLGQACRVVECWRNVEAADKEALNKLALIIADMKANASGLKSGRERGRKMSLNHKEHDGEKVKFSSGPGKAGRRRARLRLRSSDEIDAGAGARAQLWLPAAALAGSDGVAADVQGGAASGERCGVASDVQGGTASGERYGVAVDVQGGTASGERCGVAGDVQGGALSAARQAELAATAKLAAALLQGRALLSAEARDLLAGATLPGAEASWSEAFQLASLLGLVRLSGAIAPAAGGRSKELRCRRCGSGEAQLRRTACLACGASCAYCEACIGMGRSKECELLIRGRYVSAVWDGGGAKPAHRKAPPFFPGSIDERLAKWSLSPAQHAAAAKALHFVEAQPPNNPSRRIRDRNAELPRSASKRLRGAVPRSPSGTVTLKGGASNDLTGAGSRLWRPSWLRSALRNPQSSQSGSPSIPDRFKNALTAIMGLDGQAAMRRQMPERSCKFPESEPKQIRSFLLWAVTGAGKTEMIFPLIDSVLKRGGQALIASPRRDVVIELDPRIRKAFPEASVVTLYGGSEQKWERGQITLSTTHQLLRFCEAFDLVIIDEIDAFPYANDPLLHYAADNACLPNAPRLLLSATPPRKLQLAAKRGQLEHARVPVRYHLNPLPVPSLQRSPAMTQILATGKLPPSLRNALKQSLERGAQIFIFVDRIDHTDKLANLLKQRLGSSLIAATSSKDPQRAQKVQDFRSRAYRILVTTTILERGVTIPKSDVFVMDADGRLFDEASLVQMAGRAGRSALDPAGSVYFFARERNSEQIRALKHIRSMNRMAFKQGFLEGKPADGKRRP